MRYNADFPRNHRRRHGGFTPGFGQRDAFGPAQLGPRDGFGPGEPRAPRGMRQMRDAEGGDRGPRGRGPRDEFGAREGFDRRAGFGPRGPREGRPAGRRSRGELRAAILLLLADEPMHGYQIITSLAERTEGAWRPSAGSVYPTLSQLADEGLVKIGEDDGGRKLATLTEAGVAHVAEHRGAFGTPWDRQGRGHDGHRDLRKSVQALLGAVEQVARTGSTGQVTGVTALLDAARRDVYALLAQAPADDTGPGFPADA